MMDCRLFDGDGGIAARQGQLATEARTPPAAGTTLKLRGGVMALLCGGKLSTEVGEITSP